MKSGLKLMAAGLVLVAAMASTGCGQNALLNPTADQVAASGTTNGNQAGNQLKPAGQNLHP